MFAYKIFSQFDVLCPYNSMSRTVLTTPCLGHWPDKGHRNRMAQAYGKTLKNFMEKMKITKERDFQNSAVLQNFEKIPTNYLVG